MPPTSSDVIVIGGGAAGLAAAGELGHDGFSVTLLEARNRLGGRILTLHRNGWNAPVELGPEFIHSGNDALWRIVRRHRLRLRRVPPRHWLYREEQLKKIDDVAASIERVTKRIDPKRMRGWSFADFMRGKAQAFDADDRNLATGFVEGFQAAPARRMSAAAIADETLDDDEQFVIPHGYDRLLAALESEIPRDRVTVRCGLTVKRVTWKRGNVQVRAGGKSFTARALVVTLPLGVWQATPSVRGAVEFDPPLRKKRTIAAKMGVGQVIRLQIRFDARRWETLLPDPLCAARRGGFGFIHSRMEGVPVWWALSSEPLLTGWAGGPAAAALVTHSKQNIFDRALASLARILSLPTVKLRGAIIDWQMHNWSRDPFSRGAYSFIAAGHENAAERFRKAVQDTLFFAGEATAGGGEAGTVHGALASGLRAAKEVKAALKVRSAANAKRRRNAHR